MGDECSETVETPAPEETEDCLEEPTQPDGESQYDYDYDYIQAQVMV